MEACHEGGQGPEEAVAPFMDEWEEDWIELFIPHPAELISESVY